MLNKTLIISILSSILISGNAIAQKNRADLTKYEHKHAFCKPWIGNNSFLTSYMDQIGYNNQEEPMYAIPVKVWVYGKENAPTLQDIKETIQNLNKLNEQNKTLITYYLYDTKFIRRKRFENFGFYWNMPWQSLFHHDRNVLNISLLNRLVKHKDDNMEFTGVCFSLTHSVFVTAKNDASVVTHEVGHFYDLKHPHTNYNKGKHKQESVERQQYRGGIFVKGNNCEINGDGLSDTEAQPILTNCTDKNCNFTSPEKTDDWGNNYRPQTDNIMSYTLGKQCRRNFTEMQKAVMLHNASKLKYADKFKLSYSTENKNISCLADEFEPDNCMENATTLKDKIEQNHTLHQIIDKKGKKHENDVDWLKFTIGKKVILEDSKIFVENGNFDNTDLKITIISKDSNPETVKNNQNNSGSICSLRALDYRDQYVYNKKAGVELVISLKDYKSGVYYIKIEQVNSAKNGDISSYKIALDLKQVEILK